MTTAIVPGSPSAWILAMRLRTLPAAIAPVLVGTAIARHHGAIHWPSVALALLGALLLQVLSNLANDLFDHQKGADTEARLGPTRAAAAGLLTPRALRLGILTVTLASLAIGAALTAWHGLPIVAIGVTAIVSAIAYTGGPYPLGYNGLGDVFVMLFFGFVAVVGTVFVAVGVVPADAFVAALPVGALATAILVVNNVRDREQDVVAGKRTLIVRFGRKAGEIEYTTLLAAAYVAPLWLALRYQSFYPLLPLLTLPIASKRLRELRRLEGAPLNETLANTAKLMAIHGLLLAIGLWFS